MTADSRTVAVYDACAEEYAARFATDGPDADLAAFIAALPAGGRVIDLGCGPGTASAHMRRAGLMPDPVDASAAMVALANARYGIGARQATFDDMDHVAAYDGAWANFSLLHAPRIDLPRHLAALCRALKPGGILHVGMKTGTGERRDDRDRFYTFVTVPELHGLLVASGFRVVTTRLGTDRGLAGTDDPYVICRAIRD
jgi:SAM-dependent methyltransferase